MALAFMKPDQSHRKYRYIEVLRPEDLRRSRTEPWSLVDGWLALAQLQHPSEPKALLEGDLVAHLPDGSVFKEVSFKTAHAGVELVLPEWAARNQRRWAKVEGGFLTRSDGEAFPLEAIRLERS